MIPSTTTSTIPSTLVPSQTGYAFRYQQEQSAQAAFEASNDNVSVKVSASYSSSTQVSLSGSYSKPLTYAPAPTVEAPEAVAPETPKRTDAANNILSFISQRLHLDVAEGADTEALESRLKAGYEGFLQGYGEAYEQLVGSGLLTPEVEAAISQTKQDVIDGINELAEELGITSPVAEMADAEEAPVEAPVDAAVHTISSDRKPLLTPQETFANFAGQKISAGAELASLLESASFDYEAYAERDFSFKLKTQDGDTVVIKANAKVGESMSYQNVRYEDAYANYEGTRYSAESFDANRFHLSIEGELDEGELSAINDLLNQVGDLSETFFSGNIEEAFEMALDVGFDTDEIARFSLNLRQEVTTKVQAAYGQVANTFDPGEGLLERHSDRFDPQKFGNSSVARLASFVDMLRDMADKSDGIGMERKTLPALASNYAHAQDKSDDEASKLQGFMSSMLERL